jgi:hypothetical protein
MAEWMEVEKELPPIGSEVFVYGAYTGDAFPKARLNKPADRRYWGLWSSREWRGEVCITHWWRIEGRERLRPYPPAPPSFSAPIS